MCGCSRSVLSGLKAEGYARHSTRIMWSIAWHIRCVRFLSPTHSTIGITGEAYKRITPSRDHKRVIMWPIIFVHMSLWDCSHSARDGELADCFTFSDLVGCPRCKLFFSSIVGLASKTPSVFLTICGIVSETVIIVMAPTWSVVSETYQLSRPFGAWFLKLPFLSQICPYMV